MRLSTIDNLVTLLMYLMNENRENPLFGFFVWFSIQNQFII